VASTKAFTAQIAWGFLLASSLNGKFSEAKSELKQTSASMQELLGGVTDGAKAEAKTHSDLDKKIAQVVDYMKDHEHAFVLGRGQNFYIALEGALKVKEITYKHFEGFAAGELKHGVIALIDKGTPVFAIVSNDESSSDMLSSVAEVKARGGMIIAISPRNNELFDIWIQTPELAHTSALVNVIPFQLLSHHLGVALGNNVDKPRNLAKSVTVK
jgi:glucosamine--fructose-6-phosphate aminotransferase (isomerizing)